MPGPGSRNKKSKAKPVRVASSAQRIASDTSTIASNDGSLVILSDAEARNMDELAADDWMTVAERLCQLCRLPDINTRKGLKKVYASFETYYKRLEALHERYDDLPRIRAGIVGIYAKLCNDSLLRNKLFEKGFLKKLIPVLGTPSCQRVALLALQAVTRHGGINARLEIAENAMPLILILENDPDDTTAELTVSVLSHALIIAYDGSVDTNKFLPKYPKLVQSLDTVRIIRAATNAAKRPNASSSLIHHAMELLFGASLYGYNAFRKHPESIQMLVAGLSSKEWEKKSGCLQSLIRLHAVEADADYESMDPIKFMTAARSFPPDVIDVLMDYGMQRCDTYLTAQCSRDFQEAIFKLVEDHDYCTFGTTIARNILKTEYSTTDGTFSVQNPITGEIEQNGDVGLPFKLWSDAFPLAAKALRKRGNPQDSDLADILEIKYFIRGGKHRNAGEVARKAIERNPKQGYWYYAISMLADPVKGLKAAKQGMKCSQLTPFVKYQLMQRAADHAGNLGLDILQQMPEAGDQKWYEGIAFLHSALDDAKTYITEAPPDNRNMRSALYWYIMLMVTIKDLSPDLHELEPAIKKLNFADKIMKLFGTNPPATRLRLTQQTIVENYKQAMETFGSIIKRSSGGCGGHKADPTSEQSEDKLAAWLEKLDLGDDRIDSAELRRVGEEHRPGGMKIFPTEKLSLYRCGWCGNPSASLKRCSGCGEVKYCDADCQKQAWASHKKVCQTKTGSTH